jgi:hypothetical protein
MITADAFRIIAQAGLEFNHTEHGHFWSVQRIGDRGHGPHPTKEDAFADALRWLIAAATVFATIDDAAVVSGIDILVLIEALLQRASATL